MWKESLLQILIAFLPVFLFMVWYSKQEKSGHSHIFIGICCGLAMLLNVNFTMDSIPGIPIDLRHVPFLIGSVYGGIPIAFGLLSFYMVARLWEIELRWDYFVFIGFLSLFVPVLFSRISGYAMRSRRGKLKLLFSLCLLLSVFQLAAFWIRIPRSLLENVPQLVGMVAAFVSVFIAVTLLCAHFIELSFERIQLQLQLHDVSLKYRKEMRRLQQFIDNSPLMVILFDREGRISHINDMTLKVVSPLGRDELLREKFSFLLDRMELRIDYDPVERILGGEEKLTEVIKLGSQTFYTVYSSIRDMPSQGTDGVLFIGHDVTELHRLKDEVDRMERLSLVGQMAASITHEIRNPMAVIRGFVQLLNERSPDDQKSYFRIVLDELDRANAIINDFLSLAQNRIVEKEPSNLNELLKELLPLIWADANMRGQMIDLHTDDGLEPIPMNSKEVKQLVLNLSRNGMEAMNDKGVLRIETQNLPGTVQLRVSDSGVGIPPEKLKRLFEPFFTTKTNGTGLGLALCLSIVERHNGKIQVESTVGEGTTFIVSFAKPGVGEKGSFTA
ncbi:ATP-binding protein [Cohnella hongkongensis]|uniref:histidine kinase n=1 Tax=Cohnella hongkongensis TaxID=178337 RepID=A0ABV9FCC6_9BACL